MKRPKGPAVCGSLQSNDCLVEVMPGAGLTIELDSPLKERFGVQMTAAVRRAADALEVTDVAIRVTDRGALDCTLTARTHVALTRALGGHDGDR